MLASAGWRLEALDLRGYGDLGAAGVAALLAAPSFVIRRLNLRSCRLDVASLLTIANAPRWPLEELDVTDNNLGDAAGFALAALSRHARLRKLSLYYCRLSPASFKALVEAAWPALTYLDASYASVAFDGPHALGAAAFAGLPALEELDLTWVPLGEAGARLLASRRWVRLRRLTLESAQLGDAGVTALARGAWPARDYLDQRGNGHGAPVSLESARRWAPALEDLLQGEEKSDEEEADGDESE